MNALIEGIKNNIISDLYNSFLQTWFREQSQNIERETKEAQETKERTWALEHRFNRSKHAQDQELPRLTTVQGIEVPMGEYQASIEILNVNDIQTAINNKYREAFKSQWGREIKPQLIKHIEHNNPEQILKQLYERHPWMQEEQVLESDQDKTTMAYECIKNLLTRTILETCNNGLETWTWQTISTISITSPRSIDPNEIINTIESLPYIDLKRDYYTRLRSIPSIGTSPDITYLNQALHRIDLYRFLVEVYPQDAIATVIDNIHTPAILPIHVSELSKFTPNQLMHFKSLLVNIDTEDNPNWILLHKPQRENINNWDMYVVALENLIQDANTAIQEFAHGKTLTIQAIDSTYNLSHNDLPASDRMLYLSIILGRALAYCHTSHADKPSLKEYRSTVPASILIEYAALTSAAYDRKNPNGYELTKINNLIYAFARRYPISRNKFLGLLSGIQASTFIQNESFLLNPQKASHILNHFDNKKITLTSSNNDGKYDTLSLSANIVRNDLTEAYYMAWHNAGIRTIVLPNLPENFVYSDESHIIEFNTSIFCAKSLEYSPTIGYDSALAIAMRTVARNRFMVTKLSDLAWKDTQSYRYSLWINAASLILNFMQEEGSSINLDFIANYKIANQIWNREYYSNTPDLSDKSTKVMWHFAQITQMGIKGIEVLFTSLIEQYLEKWDPIYKTPLPNLAGLFDLNGSYYDNPKAYSEAILDKLAALHPQFNDCHPIFKSLGFIMPEDIPSVSMNLVKIFKEIDKQKKANKQAIGEIDLYNLDMSQENACLQFFSALEQEIQSGLIISIRIPEWDRNQYDKPNERALKAQYRTLQNMILENQRQFKLQLLNEESKPLELIRTNRLQPEVSINDYSELKTQNFQGSDVLFPLPATSLSLNIQQQMQEATQQELQQEQVQEMEQKLEEEQDIDLYTGSNFELIHRFNIDSNERCVQFWNACSAKNKAHSGWGGDSLRLLFTLWVGSEVNAEHVIKYIEPTAIEKLMEFAPAFRLGVSRDNLPAGFFLAKEKDGLVLCYNEKRGVDNFVAYNQKPKALRNPFMVQLYKPMKACVFRGDYRQFSFITDDPASLKSLWKHLATEDSDIIRLQLAKSLVDSIADDDTADENISVQVQEFTISGTISESPDGINQILQILNNYAQKTVPEAREVIDLLFNPQSTMTFSEKNLLAFGQLFYDHEVQTVPRDQENATKQFLLLAQTIYTHFGDQHFATWKKAVLDQSENFSELITKNELEAIGLSIATLKNHESISNVWWSLVAAHAQATGHVRYDALWASMQKFLSYTEQHRATINTQSMLMYLSSAQDFNAQVFLDRLVRLLKNCESGYEKLLSQEQYLNNVHKIDWKHSGAYYTVYEKYPYWDEDLNLSGFKDTPAGSEPSYLPQFDKYSSSFRVAFPINKNSTLRFIAQKLKVPYSSFAQIKAFLNANIPQSDDADTTLSNINSEVLRLYVGCLSQGMDDCESLTNHKARVEFAALYKVDCDLLQEIGELFDFKTANEKGRFHLKFSDITTFIAAINESNTLYKFRSMTKLKQLEFVNGCGNAVQCFSSDHVQMNYLKGKTRVHALSLLIDFHINVAKTITEKHILLSCPWMIFERLSTNIPIRISGQYNAAAQIQEFEALNRQLNSINFLASTYLPTIEEYCNLLEQIEKNALSSKQKRKEFTEAQIAKGCAIVNQEAAYSPLNDEEILFAREFLDKYLKPTFKSQNKRLAQNLFAYLALDTNPRARTAQIKSLVQTLVSFDNKPYYNDLGQILGLLVEKAHANEQKRYYCVEQLNTWLFTLVNEHNMQNVHFPTELLAVILDRELSLDEQGTLINTNLNRLSCLNSQSLFLFTTAIANAQIPNQYKPALAKALLVNNDSRFVLSILPRLQILHRTGYNNRRIKLLCTLVEKMGQNNRLPIFSQRQNIAEFLLSNINAEHLDLVSIWHESLLKFSHILLQYGFELSNQELQLFLNNDALEHIIMMQALGSTHPRTVMQDLITLSNLLNSLTYPNKVLLAQYYANPPRPSLDLLITLLSNQTYANDINALNHHFETKLQAGSNRHYSITDSDREDLLRVFAGFKQKGKGYVNDQKQKAVLNSLYYINSYSESNNIASIPFEELLEELHKQRVLIANTSDVYASARMLACMREILIRKTGKWVNHTQMLDLVYASMHNDESILHQVQTGQGKSIISLMRVAYLALNGAVVDLYSAKDSLSRRDHKEFGYVLDAMGIRNAYISPDSPPDTYQVNLDSSSPGTVNFGTIGNISLFESKMVWDAKGQILVPRFMRVAFIDEADFVLKLEKTQFNFSAADDKDTVYNFDAWVYTVAGTYYAENKDKFHKDAKGNLYISQNKDLKGLCEALQLASKNRPKQSEFLEKYIVHAAGDNPEPQAVDRRNSKLKSLLTAAHIAAGLKEGIHYCIRSEFQQLGQSAVLLTRAGKVLIANQIKDGSTYSDHVHQCLHARLNEEAIAKGQAPNFFIEPDTQIALSSNAKWRLKSLYSIIEGCSGTIGNADDVKEYQNTYNVHHVIKLPTHEINRSIYLPTIYASDQDTYIQSIIHHIEANRDRPILVTCEDDTQVKRLFSLLKMQLQHQNKFQALSTSIIVDTNDSGKTEDEVVPLCSGVGKITISSRMGRGTDIKPETDLGLMVIRTYPTIPQIIKQEMGRQGRNGMAGIGINIYNYEAILASFTAFQESSEFGARINHIYEQEKVHLLLKLQKHEHTGSEKYSWLRDNTDMQVKYLQARSVERLKYAIAREKETYQRKKEYLIAALSGNIALVLNFHMNDSEFPASNLKRAWLECKSEIESLWNTRLAGKEVEDHNVYNNFIKQAIILWRGLCVGYSDLNPNLLETAPPLPNRPIPKLEEAQRDEDVVAILQLLLEELKTQIALETPLSDLERTRLNALDKTLRQNIAIKYHTDKVKGKASIFLMVQQVRELIDMRLELSDATQSEENKEMQHAAPIVAQDQEQEITVQGYDFESILSFYQSWVHNLTKVYTTLDANAPCIRNELLGTDPTGLVGQPGLTKLFQSLYKASYDCQDRVQEPEPEDEVGDVEQNNTYVPAVLKTVESLAIGPYTPDNFSLQPRIQLFNALKELPTASYFIPMDTLATVVDMLSTKFQHKNFKNYLTCLHYFFDQDLLKDNYIHSIELNEIRKYAILCTLLMSIVTTKYLSNQNEDSRTLISNLTSILHKNYWDSFNQEFADAIANLFADNPNTTAALSSINLESDLDFILDLIKQNMDCHPDLMDSNKDRIKQFKDYVQIHHRDIRNNIGLIRPLLTLTLVAPNVAKTVNQLPNASSPKNVSSPMQLAFWNFLVQRQPLVKEDIDAFLDVLHHGIDSEYFYNEVYKPLMHLPPYIPLSYISKQLFRKISANNHADAVLAVGNLNLASQAFIKYAHNKNLITQVLGYEPIKDTTMAALLEQFQLMTPEQNREFFETCSATDFTAVPARAALELAKICNQEKLNSITVKNLIRDNFEQLIVIHGLTHPIAQVLEAYHCDNIAKAKGAINPKLQTFLSALSSIRYQDMQDWFLEDIWDEYINNDDYIDIGDILSALDICAHAPMISPEFSGYLNTNIYDVFKVKEYIELTNHLLLDSSLWNDLLSLYLSSPHSCKEFIEINRVVNLGTDSWGDYLTVYKSHPEDYKEFMEMSRNESMSDAMRLQVLKAYCTDPERCVEFIDLTRNVGLDQAGCNKLLQRYMRYEIKTKNELLSVIESIGKAMDLAVQNNWALYFGDNPAKRDDKGRISIMKLIVGHILDFGQVFINRCYSEYQRLINSEIDIPDFINLTVVQRQAAIIRSYRKVLKYTDELCMISTTDTYAHEYGVTETNKRYNITYFKQKAQSYDAMWFKNSKRKEQAAALFTSLDELQDAHEGNYYIAALSQIIVTQQEILEGDKGSESNSKGYSRLYDICSQMFIHVAKQCIMDPESITCADHLYDLIEQQFKLNLSVLQSELPQDHVYKSLFGKYDFDTMTKGSVERQTFFSDLHSIDIEIVPEHLRLLITNLECFTDIDEPFVCLMP